MLAQCLGSQLRELEPWAGWALPLSLGLASTPSQHGGLRVAGLHPGAGLQDGIPCH